MISALLRLYTIQYRTKYFEKKNNDKYHILQNLLVNYEHGPVGFGKFVGVKGIDYYVSLTVT